MALEVGNPYEPTPPPDNTPTPDTTFDPSESLVTVASADPSVGVPASSIPSSLLSPQPLGGGGLQRPDNDPVTMLKALMPTPEQVEKKRRQDESTLLAQIGEREKFEKQEAAYNDAYHSQAQRLLRAESYTGDEKPWDPQTMAPPPTNIWEKFGSPGFIFAMLAGSFSAMPMNSALMGGAAAMNAINNGDMDGYEKAYQAWKDNTALAIKRHDQEHREFEDIMKIWERDNAHAREMLEEHLNKYGDYGKLAMLRAGYDADLFEAYAGQAKAIGAISKMQGEMDEQHAMHMGITRRMEAGMPADQAYNETLKEREEAKKPFEGRKLDLAEWKARMDEQHKNITDDVKEKRLTLDEAKEEIDRVHKQNMDAIAAGRLDASITRDQEMERWHRAREELDKTRVEKEDEKEKARESEAGRKLDLAVEVASGRMTAAQARQKANEDHQKRVDDERERHNRAMEELSKTKATQTKTTTAVSPDTAKAVKDDLETALGHPLGPEITAKLDAVLSGKTGAKGPILTNAVTDAIQTIKDRLKAGESEEKINPAKVIGDAIGVASVTSTARSGPAAFVQALLAKNPEKKNDPEWLKEKLAEYKEAQSAAGTLGTRAGAIETSVEELKSFGDAAIEARQAIGGSNITPFNDWQQVLNRSTGVEGQGSLDVWTAEVLTAYATAISRGNQPTVTAQQRAIELLKGAYSVEAYTERVRTMQAAADKIKSAVQAAGKSLLGAGKPPAQQRYKELESGGVPENDIYKIMHEEGY